MPEEKKESKFYGLGRRKSATARVWLSEKNKEKMVGELTFEQYFTTTDSWHRAMSALVLTSKDDEMGIVAKVSGGGKQAQADAVKLACARALLKIDPELRRQLKEAGMLKRDPRVKERKKFGLKRARRAPQFSKR